MPVEADGADDALLQLMGLPSSISFSALAEFLRAGVDQFSVGRHHLRDRRLDRGRVGGAGPGDGERDDRGGVIRAVARGASGAMPLEKARKLS